MDQLVTDLREHLSFGVDSGTEDVVHQEHEGSEPITPGRVLPNMAENSSDD